MIPTFVVIPTLYVNYLENIVENLTSDPTVSGVFIFDNGVQDQSKLDALLKYENVALVKAHGRNIYEMWNVGWDFSAQEARNMNQPKYNVAFLNDDIYFSEGTMAVLSNYLRKDAKLGVVCPDYHSKVDDIDIDYLQPEYVSGTFGQNGISGFAFMLKGEIPIRFDSTFVWWYGDDSAFLEIEELGFKMARINGLPLEHAGSLSARRKPEIEAAIEKDRQYFNQKHNENRQRW